MSVRLAGSVPVHMDEHGSGHGGGRTARRDGAGLPAWRALRAAGGARWRTRAAGASGRRRRRARASERANIRARERPSAHDRNGTCPMRRRRPAARRRGSWSPSEEETMAEIRVEEKRRSLAWLWLLLAL